MTHPRGDALKTALQDVLASLSGGDPSGPLLALEAVMVGTPESDEELRAMSDAVASVLGQVSKELEGPLKDALAQLPPGALDAAISSELTGVGAATKAVWLDVLTDVDGFLEDVQGTAREATHTDERQSIIAAYDLATRQAAQGETASALQLATGARDRAQTLAPELVPRGSLTLAFVWEQAADPSLAAQAYETAWEQAAQAAEQAPIEARAALGVSRVLDASASNLERRRQALERAWTLGQAADDTLVLTNAAVGGCELATQQGDVVAAVHHLVQGRIAVQQRGGDVEPLNAALTDLVPVFGEQAVMAEMTRRLPA